MRYYFRILKFIDNKGIFLSLKENISMVKEELNSEEKFFEKAVMTEKFVKKYKNIMIATVVAIVVIVSANFVYTSNEDSRIDAANAALSKLMKDSKDVNSLSELKTLSPNLYDVYMYSQGEAIKNSKALIINDLIKYKDAKDANALDEYASKQDAIYRDLALVQSAVILINENKIEEAHNKLSKVSKDSSLNKVASALAHYGVK